MGWACGQRDEEMGYICSEATCNVGMELVGAGDVLWRVETTIYEALEGVGTHPYPLFHRYLYLHHPSPTRPCPHPQDRLPRNGVSVLQNGNEMYRDGKYWHSRCHLTSGPFPNETRHGHERALHLEGASAHQQADCE